MTKHAKTRRPRRAPYSKKPYTPQATQAAVTALALTGKNETEIGKEVGIDPETVGRLLSRHEVQMFRGQGRSVILEAVSKLSKLLVEIALKKDLGAIVVALRGIGVLTNKLEIETSSIPEERTYAFPKIAFFHKHGRWPTLKEAIAFDKTLDVEPLVKESEE